MILMALKNWQLDIQACVQSDRKSQGCVVEDREEIKITLTINPSLM